MAGQVGINLCSWSSTSPFSNLYYKQPLLPNKSQHHIEQQVPFYFKPKSTVKMFGMGKTSTTGLG